MGFGYRRTANKIGYRLQCVHLARWFLLLVFLCILGYGGYIYFQVFQPTLTQLGEAQASRLAQEILHSAVMEVAGEDEFADAKLVSLELSEDGQIAAVVPDVVQMNRYKAKLALRIQQKLSQTEETTVFVPAGSLLGVEFLSAYGPRLPIRLIPYGRTLVDLESHFSDAGINQTRHQMIATVSLDLSLLMPDYRSVGTQVTARIPMSETVVVGSVPNSYTNLETEPGKVKDDLINMIE
ncbi:MAG: sporulation protein YunB [Clostridia bacterium]|nr:sporulation protein YunB [Clostridia bacterium]